MARKNLKAKVLSVLEIIGFECADEDRARQEMGGKGKWMGQKAQCSRNTTISPEDGPAHPMSRREGQQEIMRKC
jgi:hypothetical protein